MSTLVFTLGVLISLVLGIVDAHKALWRNVDAFLTECLASKTHTAMLLLGILLTFQLFVSFGGVS